MKTKLLLGCGIFTVGIAIASVDCLLFRWEREEYSTEGKVLNFNFIRIHSGYFEILGNDLPDSLGFAIHWPRLFIAPILHTGFDGFGIVGVSVWFIALVSAFFLNRQDGKKRQGGATGNELQEELMRVNLPHLGFIKS